MLKNNRKNQKIYLLILLVFFLLLDFALTKYGRGIGLFSDNLVGETNVDYNKYDGFLIENVHIVKIIYKGQLINNDTVKCILKYRIENNEIQTVVELSENKLVRLDVYNIISENKNDKLYKYRTSKFIEDEKGWIKVKNNTLIPIYIFMRFIFFFLSIILIIKYFMIKIGKRNQSDIIDSLPAD